jgi:hypothetical protein
MRISRGGLRQESLVLIGLSVMLVYGFAAAGGAGNTGLGALSPRPAGWSIGTGVSHAFAADLERGDPGDVAITRYPVRLSYNLPSDRRGFLSLNGVYEYSDYTWSETDLLDASNRVAFSAIGLRVLGESNWGLFGFGQVSWAAEADGGSLGRGFSSTALVGPAYRFSRNLSVTAGALVTVQPERDPRVLPVAAVNWRINDQWSLRTLNGVMISYLPETDLRFQVDLFGEFRSRGIRLRRQLVEEERMLRPAVEEREIAAGTSVAWWVSENVVVQGSAEYLFARKWDLRAGDSRIRTLEAANTPQLAVRVDYVF